MKKQLIKIVMRLIIITVCILSMAAGLMLKDAKIKSPFENIVNITRELTLE